MNHMVALLVALLTALVFGALSAAAWLTPNGRVWSNFQRLTFWLFVTFAAWAWDVVGNPHRYAEIDLRRGLVYAAVLMAAGHSARLAFDLKREAKKNQVESPDTHG